MSGELSVYLHIPFCARKCLYCDFLSFPAGKPAQKEYVQALCEETEKEASLYRDYAVDTVFLGGGTPSLLDVEDVEKILCKLKKVFRFLPFPEITIECNPGTVTEEALARYRAAGINRLSIGAQSLCDRELRELGRIHDVQAFRKTYWSARQAGFDNINVDLMSSLPGQSTAGWLETLKGVAELKPEHLSAYSLMIEEGTPFYERYGDGRELHTDVGYLPLPSEDEDREMYKLTEYFLKERGYHRYEISNYAGSGRECRHNLAYWTRKDYVGFGLGASSMVNNIRWNNTKNFSEYVNFYLGEKPPDAEGIPLSPSGRESRQFPRENVQRLTIQEQMEEFMFLGLRLTKGIDPSLFEAAFGCPIREVYAAALDLLERQRLLLIEDGRIRLTGLGLDVSNYAMSQFLF